MRVIHSGVRISAAATYTDQGSGTTRGGAIRMAQKSAASVAVRDGHRAELCRLMSASSAQIGVGLWRATVTISCSRP